MTDPTQEPISRLEALGGMAAEVDAANPTPEAAAAAQADAAAATDPDTGAREWSAIPQMIGGLACMIEPDLARVYTQDACHRWGQAAQAVAEKHGWNTPDKMPEFALFMSSAAFAVPTFFLVREKLELMREGKASGLLAKVGVWWRSRKAAREAKAAAKAAAGAGEGGTDGRAE